MACADLSSHSQTTSTSCGPNLVSLPSSALDNATVTVTATVALTLGPELALAASDASPSKSVLSDSQTAAAAPGSVFAFKPSDGVAFNFAPKAAVAKSSGSGLTKKLVISLKK